MCNTDRTERSLYQGVRLDGEADINESVYVCVFFSVREMFTCKSKTALKINAMKEVIPFVK